MKRTSLIILALSAELAGLAGCDPVANDQYQGKVLATLHAMVSTGSNNGDFPPPPPVEAALVWGRPDGMATKFIAEKVPITGMFPAAFTLQLQHPPPANAGGTVGGVKLNEAFLAALEQTDLQPGTLLEVGRHVNAYGIADELVLHLDRTVATDAPLAVALGGVHDAGFHVMQVVEITAAQAQARATACRALFPEAPSSSCSAAPSSDGRYEGIVEAPEGLAHVIKLEVSFEPTIITGGDEPDAPCPDCDDAVSSGGGSNTIGNDGGASGADGGCSGGSVSSSSGSSSGGGSTPGAPGCPPGSTGPIGDPNNPRP